MYRSLLLAVPMLLGVGATEMAAAPASQPTSAISAPAGVVRPEAASATQPVRILDTRIGLGSRPGKLAPGEVIAVAVPPAQQSGATSVVLNLTAAEGLTAGWLKAWPCNQAQPATSSLNYTAVTATANAVMIAMPSAGVCITTNQYVSVIADVNGWFTGTDDFVGSAPNRLLDTRVTGNPLIAGVERRLKIAGTPGISPGATVAALNLTVDRPARAGWVVAYPCGQAVTGSTVNFQAGDIMANLTLVALSGGDVCIRSMVDVQLVVDSFGWSTGAGILKVQSPNRLLDTRDPANWAFGPAYSGQTMQLRVAGRAGIPNNADSALVTVTVADPLGEGFVTVWPCDQPFPTASTINTFPLALRSNLALVKLSVTDGETCLKYVSSNGTPTQLVVDAVGWVTGNVSRSAPTGTGRVSCSLGGAVFCETFGTPQGDGGKAGDLNPTLWGVSRVGDANPGQGVVNDLSQMSMSGCGSTAWSFTPKDVRICNGRMFETLNDGGGVVSLNTYPKQPFDFANRTGTVVFDVSADSDGSHGAWPEFVITDKPVPGMRSMISDQAPPGAANEIGFTLDGGCTGVPGSTGVGLVFVTKNNVYSQPSFSRPNCVKKGNLTSLNHFEVHISQNRLEVWGTDPGSSALKQLAVADNLGLTFTKGLVWLNDVHYNARKSIEPCECGTQWNHTFAWDNLAFDGPKTYRDLGFNVPDANLSADKSPNGDARVHLGYLVGNGPRSFNVDNVYWNQTPTGALVVLNSYSFASVLPTVSVNGNAPISTPWPFQGGGYSWRSLAIPIPLNQVHGGTNTLTFTSGDVSTTVANVTLIIVAGAPVP